jgi:hypothetical protein
MTTRNISKRSLERALGEDGTRLATDQAIAYQRRYGSQGAASAVRRIDPKTGAVIEVLEARQPGERAKPRAR